MNARLGTDRTTKLLLAVIACCGVYFCARDLVFANPAHAQSSPQTLEATSLSLVDAAGSPRAFFGVKPDGWAMLELLDPKGRKRAEIGAGERGAQMHMFDTEGHPRLELRSDGDGMVRIVALAADGSIRARLMVTPDAAAWLELSHGKGGRASLRVAAPGQPDIELEDGKAMLRGWLGVLQSGMVGLTLFDGHDRAQAALYAADHGLPGLSLFDEDKRCRVAVGSALDLESRTMKTDAPAGVSVYDAEHRVVWKAP